MSDTNTNEANPDTTICPGCGNKIDPDVCHCGDLMKAHDAYCGHTPVPMGCDCGRRKLSDFKPKMRVAYIPSHARGSMSHVDVERGTVSSIGARYVFVKFDKQLAKFGWEGTTSQSCDHRDLTPL